MKKIVKVCVATMSLLATAAVVTSCGGGNELSNTYNVVGVVEDPSLEGARVVLNVPSARGDFDETKVVDGMFALSGELAQPTIYQITIGEGRESKMRLAVSENDTVEVNVAADGETSIGGGAESSELFAFMERVDQLVDEYYPKFQKESDQKRAQVIYDEFMTKRTQLLEEGMQSNKDNMVGVFCVWQLAQNPEITLAQLDELIAKVPLSGEFSSMKSIRTKAEGIALTEAGKMFVDFDGRSIDGKEVKLSDYVGKGKYVLVDFWASWCGPCRAEMPNLKRNYDKYKADGLVLLGVNVWDKHKAFLQAVEEEKMTWDLIYASDDTEATDRYGIRGIPTIILFGPDGKIIDRTLRGNKIGAKLEEIFGR